MARIEIYEPADAEARGIDSEEAAARFGKVSRERYRQACAFDAPPRARYSRARAFDAINRACDALAARGIPAEAGTVVAFPLADGGRDAFYLESVGYTEIPGFFEPQDD